MIHIKRLLIGILSVGVLGLISALFLMSIITFPHIIIWIIVIVVCYFLGVSIIELLEK